MDKDTIQKIVVMYLSANEETKQEIKDVLKYLDMLVKVKSWLLLIERQQPHVYNIEHKFDKTTIRGQRYGTLRV